MTDAHRPLPIFDERPNKPKFTNDMLEEDSFRLSSCLKMLSQSLPANRSARENPEADSMAGQREMRIKPGALEYLQ